MIALVSAVAGAAMASLAVYCVMRTKLAKAEMESQRNSIALESERRRIEDMQHHYDDMRAQSEAQFKTLAQRIFEERSEKLKAEGMEHIKGVVNPLLEHIREFRKKIEENTVATAERNGELKIKIENLVAQTNAVTAQANNLADAIRGDAQLSGEWGEIQLKRVLELAGFS
jgi:DNA recombination protein RmuC